MEWFDKQKKRAEKDGVRPNDFSQSLATTVSKWLELAPFSLLAILSLEQTIRTNVTDSGKIGD